MVQRIYFILLRVWRMGGPPCEPWREAEGGRWMGDDGVQLRVEVRVTAEDRSEWVLGCALCEDRGTRVAARQDPCGSERKKEG